MKFTFVAESENQHGEVVRTNTLQFEGEFLDGVLLEMQEFLRGCGYYFDGQLQLVIESDVETQEEQYQNSTWNHVVDSLMNPPHFRANQPTRCTVCNITLSEFERGHKCFDKKCPCDGIRYDGN